MKCYYSVATYAVVLFLLCSLKLSRTQTQEFYGKLESGTRNYIYDYKPPEHIRRLYPWHTLGFDYEGRIVIFNEIGSWNLKELAADHDNDLENFSRHFEQGMQLYADLALLPKRYPNGTEYGPQGSAFVVDLEGFNMYDIADPRVTTIMVEIFTKLANVNDFTAYGYFVNLNNLAQVLLNRAIRPIIPKVLSKIEIFGPEKEKYLPALLKRIPLDQLPLKIGGMKNISDYIAPLGQCFNFNMK